MHSCLDSKPKLAGWRRRQEEASSGAGNTSERSELIKLAVRKIVEEALGIA